MKKKKLKNIHNKQHIREFLLFFYINEFFTRTSRIENWKIISGFFVGGDVGGGLVVGYLPPVLKVMDSDPGRVRAKKLVVLIN